MKTLTIDEAQNQLGQLIDEACQGELIVLTKGEKRVTLEPRAVFDPEEDSPELEAELLRAAEGPFTPFSPGELREECEQIARKRRAR